jgi:hypothetical protein
MNYPLISMKHREARTAQSALNNNYVMPGGAKSLAVSIVTDKTDSRNKSDDVTNTDNGTTPTNGTRAANVLAEGNDDADGSGVGGRARGDSNASVRVGESDVLIDANVRGSSNDHRQHKRSDHKKRPASAMTQGSRRSRSVGRDQTNSGTDRTDGPYEERGALDTKSQRASNSSKRGRSASSNGARSFSAQRQQPKRTRKAREEGGFKLYISGIPYASTDVEIERLFCEYGKVTSAHVMRDHTGRSKGSGFVTYGTVEEAESSIEGLNGSFVMDKTRALRVDYARPKPKGSSNMRTGSGGGGGGAGPRRGGSAYH